MSTIAEVKRKIIAPRFSGHIVILGTPFGYRSDEMNSIVRGRLRNMGVEYSVSRKRRRGYSEHRYLPIVINKGDPLPAVHVFSRAIPFIQWTGDLEVPERERHELYGNFLIATIRGRRPIEGWVYSRMTDVYCQTDELLEAVVRNSYRICPGAMSPSCLFDNGKGIIDRSQFKDELLKVK